MEYSLNQTSDKPDKLRISNSSDQYKPKGCFLSRKKQKANTETNAKKLIHTSGKKFYNYPLSNRAP